MSGLFEMVSTIGFFAGLIVLAAVILFFARPRVVWAIAWRNLKEYFTNALGYVFIVAFVTVCAVLAFNAQFFLDNQANLDQLTRYFPFLLLFFVPALTMSIWSEEKKQGTDAILFTLPASDIEILLGKYLSIAFSYSIALLFSLTQAIALAFLGDPDWGILFTTYLGYWLAGLSLAAIGMFASSVTDSATIAFVFGAILCSIPVLLFEYFPLGGVFQQLSYAWHMTDFSIGFVPLPSIVYFLSIIIVFLYLNHVVITQRHWSRGQVATMTAHFGVRFMALLVGLLAIYFTYDRLSSFVKTRIDLTSQQLFSLDELTRTTIKNAEENDRPITIQAFISPDVPRNYVNLKKQFVGILRQLERIGGNVHVEFVEVKANSEQAKQAETLGIEPRNVTTNKEGVVVEQDVYLGAHVSSTLGDTTIPFVDSSSVEYELTSAIATTSDKQKKLVIAVLETDVHFDGLKIQLRPEEDPQVFEWNFNKSLVELKKHYDFVRVTPAELNEMVGNLSGDNPAVENSDSDASNRSTKRFVLDNGPDVLLVVGPSTLTESGLNQLQNYVDLGRPVLMLDDPLPFYRWTYLAPEQLGVVNAPKQPRISNNRAQFAVLTTDFDPNQQFQFIPPKADEKTLGEFLASIGIKWNVGLTVWDANWPHVDFQPRLLPLLGERWPKEYGPLDNAFVFSKKSGAYDPFAGSSDASKGLNEVLFFYPGCVTETAGTKLDFQPLVSLSEKSGSMSWESLTEIQTEEQVQFDDFGQPKIDPRTNKPMVTQQVVMNPATGAPLTIIRTNPPSQFRNVIQTGQVVEQGEQLLVKLDQEYSVDADQFVSVIRGAESVADKKRVAAFEPFEVEGSDAKEGDAPDSKFYSIEITGFDNLKVGDKIEFFNLLPAFDESPHHIAAHVSGENAKGKKINVIFVADYDFLTDYYHDQVETLGQNLDNIMFFQNCVETLAGQPEFVRLRSRRVEPRSLSFLENRIARYRTDRFRKQQAFASEVEGKLEEAQTRLDKITQSIQDDESLSMIQKLQQNFQQESTESKRFLNEKSKLEEELNSQIDELKSQETAKVESDQFWTRIFTATLAPLPPLLLGICVFFFRRAGENAQVASSRRVNGGN